MKDDKVSILNRHISRRIDDILIIIFQIRIKIIIDISSFRVMLYSYSFKDTNSVNKLSSISVNVIDFFKPRRTWSPLSLIRFHARPLSRITVGRLLTLSLLGQVPEKKG